MSNYKYVVDSSVDEPIMLLTGAIGIDAETGEGIDGACFQSELLRLDAMGKKRIQVHINSIGGLVTDGFAIYSAIAHSKTKVDTYNVGIAASIAGVIFQAGRTRYSADYSILMLHAPYNPDNPKDANPGLKAMQDATNIMIQRSGMSRAEVERMYAAGDSYFTADQALSRGLTDVIVHSADVNAKRAKYVAIATGQIFCAAPRGVMALMEQIAAKTKRH